jgi:hypothetical protein
MTMDTDEIEKAVEQRRVWLQGQLNAVAARFGVELVGEVVNTFDMRSAGAPAHDGDRAVWLRVVVEDPDYQPAGRWDGNVEANSIRGVPKPEVLRWADWQHSDSDLAGRRLRGEVMTLAPGSTIAPGGVLFDDPHLPESWWADLDAALAALAAHPVNMEHELGAVRLHHQRRPHALRTAPARPDRLWHAPAPRRCVGKASPIPSRRLPSLEVAPGDAIG